jgi:hypothetical protein
MKKNRTGYTEYKLNKVRWSQRISDLAGKWKDDFPTLEKIRSNTGQDSVREKL